MSNPIYYYQCECGACYLSPMEALRCCGNELEPQPEPAPYPEIPIDHLVWWWETPNDRAYTKPGRTILDWFTRRRRS